jgi:hypothetical protein
MRTLMQMGAAAALLKVTLANHVHASSLQKKEAAVSTCNLQLVVMWLINVPLYVLY